MLELISGTTVHVNACVFLRHRNKYREFLQYKWIIWEMTSASV